MIKYSHKIQVGSLAILKQNSSLLAGNSLRAKATNQWSAPLIDKEIVLQKYVKIVNIVNIVNIYRDLAGVYPFKSLFYSRGSEF